MIARASQLVNGLKIIHVVWSSPFPLPLRIGQLLVLEQLYRHKNSAFKALHIYVRVVFHLYFWNASYICAPSSVTTNEIVLLYRFYCRAISGNSVISGLRSVFAMNVLSNCKCTQNDLLAIFSYWKIFLCLGDMINKY